MIAAKAEALGLSAADYEKSLLRYTSMRTMVEPEDIAATIAFLVSEEAGFVSGQVIYVAGGPLD